jgi:hypothetical protein
VLQRALLALLRLGVDSPDMARISTVITMELVVSEG